MQNRELYMNISNSKSYSIIAPKNAFFSSKSESTRAYFSLWLSFFCFNVHFRSCLSNIVCLIRDWNDQMNQLPSTGVLGHMGMYHKCFLSVLPNVEQCVKCILVTTKDTYGHWDVCQMEYGAKGVLWYALEQVMTCWEEEVKTD